MSDFAEQPLVYETLDPSQRAELGIATVFDLRTGSGVPCGSLDETERMIEEALQIATVRDNRSRLLVGAGFLIAHHDGLEIIGPAVRFDFRRRGIGTKIFDSLLDDASSSKYQTVRARPSRDSLNRYDYSWQERFLRERGFARDPASHYWISKIKHPTSKRSN